MRALILRNLAWNEINDFNGSALTTPAPSFRTQRSGDPESIVEFGGLRWIPDLRRWRGLSGMTARVMASEQRFLISLDSFPCRL